MFPLMLINYIYVLELKLTKNGGIDFAEKQIKEKNHAEPFKADKREAAKVCHFSFFMQYKHLFYSPQISSAISRTK